MKARIVLPALLAVGLLALAAAGLGTWTSSASGADPNPGGTPSHWVLTVQGNTVGIFGDAGIVSGYDTSGLALGPKGVVPGKQLPPTIVLKRGLSSSMDVSAWHELALTDLSAAQKDASVTLFDTTFAPIAKWTLESAWPSRLEVGTLQSGASSTAPLETVTLVGRSLHRVAP